MPIPHARSRTARASEALALSLLRARGVTDGDSFFATDCVLSCVLCSQKPEAPVLLSLRLEKEEREGLPVGSEGFNLELKLPQLVSA